MGISFVNVEIKNFIKYLKEAFCEKYKIKDIEFFGVGHHEAHAISTYYTSNFNKAIILISDGAGDAIGDKLESESLYIAEGNQVFEVEKRLHEIFLDIPDRPFLYNFGLMNESDKNKEISIAKKYEQFTNLLGFGHFQDGKTMGLSSYGKPLFKINNFPCKNLDFSLKCKDLLNKVHDLKLQSGLPYHKFIRKNRANLAKTVQTFIENLLISLCQAIRDKYNYENFCLAGGLFLNCVANHKLAAKKLFKEIHIIPAAGDDGQSIGTAFYAYEKLYGNSKRTSSSLPFLGLSYSNRKILQALKNFNLRYTIKDDNDLARYIAKSLFDRKIVAILRGRSEIGPRALCHRSILADPRHSHMKKHLNKYIKFREGFRPYAPVVTSDAQYEYFNLAQSSPYMLFATSVKPDYRSSLRAITHVDNSARVQSIAKEKDSFIHKLLIEFKKLTGFPILLNTSFNLAGEAIVETPHDAISCFLSTKIDTLIIENFIVEKSQNTDRE